MSIMGTRVVRTEDPAFLTRGGTYTADLALPGALHLTLVRSPVAHARIASVDVEEARSAPGVVDVVTGADVDLGPVKMGPVGHDAMVRPFLATDRVRFVGEPVAAVLTEQAYEGPDAAELVVVDYDPLPAVVDMRAAARDEVLLFDEAGTNTVVGFGLEKPFDEHLFDGCDAVVTAEIVNQRLAAAPLETRAAAAQWGDDGRLTLWCSTQNAQATRDEVAGWLGIEPGRLRVITPDVGGGFGAKIGADPEFALVGWLAKRTGRAVRWSESRSENMTGMLQGRAQRQTVTIGGTRDGRVLAYRLDILADAGAYPRLGAFLPYFTSSMAPAVYDIARVESRARVVATTTTSIGAYRGAGRPEATAAIERAMDLFATEIAADPAEVRKRNLIPPDAFPFRTKGGVTYDSGEYAKALDRVLDAAGYAELRAEQAARRERGDAVQLGIGLATFVEITGGGAFAEDASVEVHPDGTVTVLTGTSPHGQGHATAWAMLASEHLGVPIEMITVRHGDTDLVPARRGHDGLAQPPDRRRRGGPGRGRAGRAGQAARGGRAGGRGRRPRGGAGRGPRARHGRLGRARPARRDRAAADGGHLRLRRTHVPLRCAPGRRRGRRRVRQGGRQQDRDRGRRRTGAQPADRRGSAARRDRPGHRPGAVRRGRVRHRRQPADRQLRRLRLPVGGRAAQLHPPRHGDPDAPQPAGREGHRRGGDHRCDAGRPERRGRRRGAPRRAAHRHARHTPAGVGSDPGRQGESS